MKKSEWIVGVAGQGVDSRGYLLTLIPEPSTLFLLGLGSLALRRRKKNSSVKLR